MPSEFKEARYGVISYHHPEIANKLNSQSPEHVLLELIDQSLCKDEKTSWKVTASKLRDFLMLFGKTRTRAQSLLEGYNEATGTYLGHLASKYPD